MVDCMAEIAAAAPKLPFYYYHIPAITGVTVNVLEFLKRGEKRIPSLAGIKYTAATLHEYQACLNYKKGKFDILFGYDELLLPSLSVGAKGAIGSTYTFAALIYLEIIEQYENRNMAAAQERQFNSIKMIQCLAKYSPIPTQKAIMKLLGIDLGPCRFPLNTLTNVQVTELKGRLEETGFFATLQKLSMAGSIGAANGT
jgi:N-acetylneuraminate lyase